MAQFLQAALDLAARGLPVFPLAPNGKTPAMERNWRELATTDPDEIRRMWVDRITEWEQPFNIGVALPDDILVVDVDVRDGRKGRDTLTLLGSLYDPLPNTYRVRTASRGDHFYYRVDPSAGPFGKTLGENVDLKAHGGYVVGPGSIIDGKTYASVGDGRPDMLAGFPEAYLPLATRGAKESVNNVDPSIPLVEPDTEPAIARATEWLEKAEPAVEGDAGDLHTFKTAARVMDFGVSADTALDLMLDHWNDRCLPPWDPEELKVKVDNAGRYRERPVGVASPEAEFGPVETDKDRDSLFDPVEPFDPATIPKRQWVVQRLAARRFVSGLVSPPGVGKTTFLMTLAVAVATGRGDIIGMDVIEKTRVLLWNQEDDADEMRLRLAGVMEAFKISFGDLGGRLYMQSGVGRSELFARDDAKGTAVATKFARQVGAFIKDEGIGLAIFDPLAEMHNVPEENNNAKIRAVAAVFRDQMAVKANCAVVLAHHTRKPPAAESKGYAGDMDSARGGGSLAGVLRIGATLYGVDKATAKAYGVAEEDRHKYIRLDDAKSNISLVSDQPTFFRREGVLVGGFEGENVGVLLPAPLRRVEPADDAVQRARDAAAVIDWIVDYLRAEAKAAGATTAAARVKDLAKLVADEGVSPKAERTLTNEIRSAFDAIVERDNGDRLWLETRSMNGVPGRHAFVVGDFEH